MAAPFIARNLRLRVGPAVILKWAPQLSLCSTSAPAISVPDVEQEKNGRSTCLKLLLFIPGVITCGLGTWQIFRRQEKTKMLEFRQSRLGIEPLKGNQILSSIGNPDSLEFRRIQCRGAFDDKKSIYVGPRSRIISGVTENGYYIITPLIPVLGDLESLQSPMLVNRWWAPCSWRDKALDVSEDDRLSSSSSTPTQEIAKISWWQQLLELVGFLRKHTIWKLSMTISKQAAYPIPKDANALICNSVMPQDHLNYTLTW